MTATVEQDREEQQETAAAQTEQLEIAPSKPSAALVKFGAMPETLQGAWIMANVYAKSQMVPKDYLQKPHNIMVAWDLGLSLGFTPMQSLQSIAVIGNRPGVWGDGFLAVCRSAPEYRDHDEYYTVSGERREIHDGVTAEELKDVNTKAVCLFYVQGRERPFGGSFSIAQAMRAGLLSKDSPWKSYPERMLLMRARGFAGRDAFPGKLRGIKTAEELRDIPLDIDVTAAEIAPPVRRSDKQLAEASPSASEPETEPEPEPGPTPPAPAPPPSPAPPPAASTGPRPAGSGATAAAGKTKPQPVKPAAPNTTGPSTTTEHLAFSESAMVQPKGAEPYYEIKAIVQAPGKAPLGFTFRTHDSALFKMAESAEGTDHTFAVRWHGARTPEGAGVKVIESIQAMD